MGTVVIRCPITGQQVPTGILMSRAEFDQAKLESSVLRCPQCGRIHTWCRKDAQLVESPPSRP